MSDLNAQFEQATVEVKDLPERPSNPDLLELYALYKQGTEGDVQGKRPGMTNVKGRFQFDAWSSKSGLSQDEAKQAYIDKVKELQG